MLLHTLMTAKVNVHVQATGMRPWGPVTFYITLGVLQPSQGKLDALKDRFLLQVYRLQLINDRIR